MSFFFKHRIIALIVLLALFSGACRKKNELASWELGLLAPLAHGKLNLSDLAKDSEIYSDNTGLLHVFASDTLLKLGLDTLIGIPDTVIKTDFSIAFSNVNFFPGVPFLTQTKETEYNLKQVELTYAEIRESLLSFKISHNINRKIYVKYTILSATKNGKPFVIEQVLDAKGSFSDDFDFNGYEIDFTGEEGNRVNTIVTKIEAMIDPSESEVYKSKAGDKLSAENRIKKIIPNYAEGFFGQQSTLYKGSEPIDILSEIQYERIDITEFQVDLTIDNGIGADLQLTIERLGSENSLTGASADLKHQIIGDVQLLGRAINFHDEEIQSKHIRKELEFTHLNSNLDALIELNPTALVYDLNLELNPLGNISYTNDFVYYGHDLTATLDIDVPLKVGIKGLQLKDTVAFSIDEDQLGVTDQVNSGYLKIVVDNAYPLEAALDFYLLDGDSNLIDSLSEESLTIEAAPTNTDNEVLEERRSVLKIPLSPSAFESLRLTKAMAIRATVNTYESNVVSIRDNQYIKFKVIAEVNAQTR